MAEEGCRFQDLGLCDALSDHMHARMGFSAPTRIQQTAIPLVLSERDVYPLFSSFSSIKTQQNEASLHVCCFLYGLADRLVNAETGTGKTIVYLAPIIHKLQANLKKVTRVDGTYALVLVPTRELCLQVYEVARQLVHRFQWLVPGYVMGGENRSKEKARLRKGVTILIATPGRLLDHLRNTSSFCYDNLRWMVFDEADRLLDLGFGKDIESILTFVQKHHSSTSSNGLKSRQQHLLLSATLGDEVIKLASLSLRKPLTVGLAECLDGTLAEVSPKLTGLSGHDNSLQQIHGVHGRSEYTLPAQLVQRYIKVPCDLRLVTLLAVLHIWLDLSSRHKVVVFFSTCDSVDFHYALLNEFCWSFFPGEEKNKAGGFLGCKSLRLHGNMSQQERTETFLEFNKEASALLLCTDVAARGLDIPRVTHIVQYDPPGDANEYVHRVGRTARLGRKGEALLFLQPCELDYLDELKKHGVTLKEFSLETIWDKISVKNREYRLKAMGLLEMLPAVLILQKAVEAFISKQVSMRHLATDAFRSYIRAYAAHKGDLKTIFQVKKLHLGHVAKSFALCDHPSLLGKSSNKKRNRRTKAEALTRTKKKRKLTPATMLE